MLKNLVLSSAIVGMLTVGAFAAPQGYPMFVSGKLFANSSLVFLNKFDPSSHSTLTLVSPDCEAKDEVNFGIFVAPMDDPSTEEDESEPIAGALEKGCVQEISFDVPDEGYYNIVITNFTADKNFIYFLESDE